MLAIRAGIQDARDGHPPYAWAIAHDPNHRADLLREGWKAVAKVFTIALICAALPGGRVAQALPGITGTDTSDGAEPVELENEHAGY